MKRKNSLALLLMCLILFALIMGCENMAGTSTDGTTPDSGSPTNPTDPSNPVNPGTGVVLKNAKLYDGSGNYLGYADPSGYSILVYTTKEHFITLQWDGTPYKSTIYFTERDGAGNAFVNSHNAFHAKNTYFANGKFYISDQFNDNNIALPSGSYTSYKSRTDGTTTTNVADDTTVDLSYSGPSYTLMEVSRQDVGLPDNIPLPLRIEWE